MLLFLIKLGCELSRICSAEFRRVKKYDNYQWKVVKISKKGYWLIWELKYMFVIEYAKSKKHRKSEFCPFYKNIIYYIAD